MLYMHGGLVRTGTTSLQTALVSHRDELAEAGIVYPDRWRLPGRVNHHVIIEALGERGEQDRALRRIRDDLQSLAGRTVLLSAESLTYWLDEEATVDRLLQLLAIARETMPVTFVWTLRSLVEVASSLYLRQMLVNRERAPEPGRFMREVIDRPDWPKRAFLGLGRLENENETLYFKYQGDGSHQTALLQAFGLPPAVLASVERQLSSEPRLNVRLSHKAAVAVLHPEEISARAGFPIGKTALGELFYRNEFRFDDDGPCRLFDGDILEEMHQRALAAARDSGFSPYIEFFGAEEIKRGRSADLHPDVLTDDDLSRLVSGLETIGAEPQALA